MRNHQQTDPEDATIAKLGDATFEKRDETGDPWLDPVTSRYQFTDDLTRYGATFWKKIVPEPGYRMVEDHERVGEKPKGCRLLCTDGNWSLAVTNDPWGNDTTYAVPTKQVVAWAFGEIPAPMAVHAAYFTNEEDRDRAVREANEREL